MILPVSAFWLRPRLLGAIGLGIVLAVALPIASPVSRLLVAWCLGVVVYIGLVVRQLSGLSQEALRRQSSRLDDSATVITLVAMVATAASVGAVVMLVAGQSAGSKGASAEDLGLAVATMISSWAFIQTVFTVHYAHVFYGDDEAGKARGGLDFNGDDAPDFWDFLYFTITIGATSQTSDTAVTTKRMRRIVTAQSAYAFLFNTSILALAVNMAAGLAGH